MKRKISIALDGPAGSGKSSVAKQVAKQFGYVYIDTGAMYRAIALKSLRAEVAADDELRLTQLAQQVDLQLTYEYNENDSKMFVMLDGEDVSQAIRSVEVTKAASAVAAVAGVRKALVELQRKMAISGGVVMDGRDIGTVVLPQAELKVFMTATVEERGKRRWLEMQAKGVEITLEELIDQIAKRDYFDSHREVDPLCQADDAILLDTTNMNIDEVVQFIVRLAEERGAERVELN